MHTIVVPDDWATVNFTDLTNREPLHDNHHTILCSVIAKPGMPIRPVVHWYYPNGSQVTNEGRVRVGPQKTDGTTTNLNLTFSTVYHRDGGEYICRAEITVPWMSTQPPVQNGTFDLVVTSKTRSLPKSLVFDALLLLSLYT